jgi:DDT domain
MCMPKRREPRSRAAGLLAERGCELGGSFLMLWSFVGEFCALLGVRAPPLTELIDAVVVGAASVSLVDVHIAMLRFVQAEAEVAHAVISHAVRRPAASAPARAQTFALLDAR